MKFVFTLFFLGFLCFNVLASSIYYINSVTTFKDAFDAYYSDANRSPDLFLMIEPGTYLVNYSMYFENNQGSLHLIGTGPGVVLQSAQVNQTLLLIQHSRELEVNNIELTGYRVFNGDAPVGAWNTSSIKIVNSYFHDNYAGGIGGAVQLGLVNQCIINNCTFLRNEASWGGAIHLGVVQVTNITNNVFTGNKATTGAAIVSNAYAPTTLSYWDNNVFNSNQGTTTVGAIHINFVGKIPFIMKNSVFFNNTAGDYGGGLNIQGGDIYFTNITFTSNFVNLTGENSVGAAIAFTRTYGSYLENITVQGNTAQAGAFSYFSTNDSVNILKNSVFTGNSVNGAIYALYSNVTVENCKVFNNNGYGIYFLYSAGSVYRTTVTGASGNGVQCIGSTYTFNQSSVYSNLGLDFYCSSCTATGVDSCGSSCQRDQCSICSGTNACIGCDGNPYSGLSNDFCNVCGGNNSTCTGCDGVLNSGKRYDACGICDGNNSTCIGCDGIVNGAQYDGCGICGGNNSTCAGCDNVLYSNKKYDFCGVCDGNNSTCTGCDGVVNSGMQYDSCGVCGGNCVVTGGSAVEEKPKTGSSSQYAIIGGAAGGGLLLLIAIALIIFFVVRRKKNKEPAAPVSDIPMRDQVYSPMVVPTGTQYASLSSPSSERKSTRGLNLVPPVADKYDLDYNEIVFEKPLGQGSFGVVWKCEWRSSPVAVKQIKDTSALTEAQMEEFLAEAVLMKGMRPHRNVVALLGMCTEPLCIVTEFCDGGSLQDYLMSGKPLDITKKMQIMKDVAAGMVHLQKESIIHRDLAARNVLLSEGLVGKVSDFGLSRLSQNKDKGVSTVASFGPLKWWAPETLLSNVFTHQSDVWSYGVMCIEILTRGLPYPTMSTEEFALRVIPQKLTPISQIPQNTPPALASLLTRCFDSEPDKRPTFQQIYSSL